MKSTGEAINLALSQIFFGASNDDRVSYLLYFISKYSVVLWGVDVRIATNIHDLL